MARKPPGVHTAGLPPVTDDFSLIKGIGPVLSQRLHEAGISTYSQLASLSPVELADKITGRSTNQIIRQDWIGQAHKLAPKEERSKTHKKKAVKQTVRQHYANFTIEFLLDEKNIMRRTRVMHVQSGDAETWAGWEPDQLVDFLSRHAGMGCPSKRLGEKDSFQARSRAPGNVQDDPSPILVITPKPLSLLPGVPEAEQPGHEMAQPVLQAAVNVNANLAGILRLQDFSVLPTGSDIPTYSLRQDQPCRVRFTLDLANIVTPSGVPLRYKATINFKQMGGASYRVGEGTSTIGISDCVLVDTLCASPPPGLYRPDAFVRLFSNEKDLGLMASLKGDLIQVF